MKKQFLVISILLVCFNLLLEGQEKQVESNIEQVTIFHQAAQISRVTPSISLSPGQSTITIKGLERSLMERSLRVGLNGNARILNVTTSLDYLEAEVNSAKIEELRKEIEENESKIKDQDLLISVYSQEKNLLISNMKLGGSNTGVQVSQIKEGADFYRQRLLEIDRTIMKANKDKIELEKKNSQIYKQLNELNYRKNQPSSTVEISLESSAPTTCKILLDYLVQEASWYASYDIRIDEVGDPVQMIRKATLNQNTGVDWKGVSLVFSTGNPLEQQNVPVLQPWYLSVVQPLMRGTLPGAAPRREVASAAMPSVKKSMVAEVDEVMAMEDFDFESSVNAFQSSSKNSILEFSLQSKASISSDGKENTFTIGNEELPAEYYYQSVPKMSKSAFLVATISDWEAFQLIDGNANIYYENMYVGETFLSASMLLDSMQLSMGKDKGIIVERKVIRDYNKTRSLGSNKRKTFAYELSVRNTKNQAVQLIMEDQVPLSSDSRITVDVEELSKGVLNESSGKVSWKIDVEPGESITIPFRYSVKYPKDLHINL